MKSTEELIDDSFLVGVEKEGVIYAEVNQDGFITGHSSTLLEGGVELKIEELPEDFMTHFSFYRVDEEMNLIYDDTRVKEIAEEQERLDAIPTKEELLEQAIQSLSEEKAILKQEILEARQRAEMTEEALLDLASMLINL